jgi:hypothetical protein
MSGISDEEVNDFCEKVEEFKNTLSSAQQALLDTIFKIAWNASVREESFDSHFDGCFKPDEAALILDYQKGDAVMAPRMIRGLIEDGMIRAPRP